MKYRAITIDTQTVYANGRHLDRGDVAQLDQYKDGPIQFVLSEIVLRELISMCEDKAKAPREALAKAIKDGDNNGQLTAAQKEQLEAVSNAMAVPNEHAKKQLKDFVNRTGAHIVPAETAPMKSLLDAYFGGHPPFATAKKKNEFPDGISLFALEHWAKSEEKKVLAVSKDEDWKSFAEKSDWIDCVEDLSEAMNSLLEGVEAIQKEGQSIVAKLIGHDPTGLRADFERFLERATENESPYIDFSSSMQAECEFASLTLKSVAFSGEDFGEVDVTVVRISDDGFVMRVPCDLVVSVEAEITFSVHDSIDGDDVPMGSKTFERDAEIEASALVHCRRHVEEGDGEKGQITYEISDVELVDFPRSVDIDYVDFSVAEEYADFDPDDWIAAEEERGEQAVGPIDEKDMPF